MDGHWITSPAAVEPLALAAAGTSGLALAGTLERRFGLTPDQRSAVLAQAELRSRAADRWGPQWGSRFFTRDGLEQASRPAVAAGRAARLRAAGVHSVTDLGCGLGFESIAFAAAGLAVTAIELDADTANFAAANLRDTNARVIVGDVTSMELPDTDAYFVDPARRDPQAPRSVDGQSGHRFTNPDDWSPPWSWVCALNKPRMVAKVAPGIPHERVPDRASITWMQCDGDLVEASVWFNELRSDARASATVIAGSAVVEELSSNDPEHTDIGAISDYLYDINGAFTRAGLVTQLAAKLGAHRIDPRLGFLSSATVVPTHAARAYRVHESLPFDAKGVVSALRNHDAGNVTLIKRAFAADTDLLRTQWMKKLSGSHEYVVVLTRIGDEPRALICEPVSR